MQEIGTYLGFEIWRTSAGHLVVMEAGSSRPERRELVEFLGHNEVLDALFFPSIEAARSVIEGYVASRKLLGRR